MAINPRPTTEFHVTYGALSSVPTERTLNPVIIAPRYRIHSYEEGYAESAIGSYSELAAKATAVAWPGRATNDTTIIDTASSAVYAKLPLVALNSTAISGTVARNKITLVEGTGSLRPVTSVNDLDDNLRGFEVKVGDKVRYTSGSEEDIATITGIQASVSTAAVGKVNNLTNASYTSITTTGEYIGAQDATYLIKVLEQPREESMRIQVMALTGDDGYLASFTISSDATTIPLGRSGVSLIFSTSFSSARAGDAWSITCTAPKLATYNIIYVDKTIADSGSVQMTFCSRNYSPDYVKLPAGVSMSLAGINVSAGARISIGDKVCELVDADLHAVYREQLVGESALTIVESAATGAAAWAGKVDPRNPMGMLYAACAGSSDDAFFYMVATDSDTDDGYIRAINYAAQFEQMYAFVTWEDTPAIYSAKEAAVAKYSAPTIAQFKKNWYAPVIERETVVYDTYASGNPVTAKIEPAEGTGIPTATLLGSSEDAIDAIVAGVAPGDILVVYQDVDDTTGEWTKSRYEITSVTQDKLTLSNGTVTAISRVAIVRSLSNTEYAKKVAAMAAGINSERVNMVWCAGEINFGGFSDVPPSVAAAILATTRGALPPHAPMTGMSLPGLTLSDTYKFSDIEYDIMNSGGVWVVANNVQDVAVNYHQITTKTDGTIAEEDSCVSAADAVVREIRNTIAPLTAGSVNVSDHLVTEIETQLRATMASIMGRTYPAAYGPLIEGYVIKDLGRVDSNNAALMLSMDIDTPQPLLKGQVYANII